MGSSCSSWSYWFLVSALETLISLLCHVAWVLGFLLLKVCSTGQQHQHYLGVCYKSESQAPPQTYWIRVCISTSGPSVKTSHGEFTVRNMTATGQCFPSLQADPGEKENRNNQKVLDEYGLEQRRWVDGKGLVVFSPPLNCQCCESRNLFCSLLFSYFQERALHGVCRCFPVTFLALCPHGRTASFLSRSWWPSCSLVPVHIFAGLRTYPRYCSYVFSLSGPFISISSAGPQCSPCILSKLFLVS